MSTNDDGCFSCCFFLAICAALVGALSAGFMFLWNELAKVFHFAQINFWIAFGILVSLFVLSSLFSRSK